VPWDYKLKSGRTLWDELCTHYDYGVKQVREFQKTWDQVERYVDHNRFTDVQKRLRDQSLNALEWKDGCLLYFQQFSKKPFPYSIELPVYNLDYLIEKDKKRVGDYHD
jgi:alpha-glucuronidase